MNAGSFLWYRTPAENFDQALPLGNGRIGGMVYGNAEHEMIHLNEDSIWSGGLRDRSNPKSFENLQKIRDLLLSEQINDAEKMLFDCMGAANPNTRHYMPLGNLYLDMLAPSAKADELPQSFSEDTDALVNYQRSLDLEQAIFNVSYERNGITYTREAFISHPHQVMVVHIRASKKGSIACKVRIDGRDDYYDDNRPITENTILYNGGTGSKNGIFFHGLMKMIASGGTVSSYGNALIANACDEVTILFAIRSSFYDTIADAEDGTYISLCHEDIRQASALSYARLKEAHIADYASLYRRVSFTLADNSQQASQLPTDQRLLRLKEAEANANPSIYDNKLVELYFNFGRYLAIAGSRPDTLPLNLQGIWNKDMWPAWGSKYTININLQMNYWPIEIFNLSECHTPLFELIERMRENGKKIAWEMYHCHGFCAHHNTDLWGDCAPQDYWMPATIWPMGAAWLCLHLFEHYQYTQDIHFLASKYDTMKEAAVFFVDYLMEDKKGRLVTGPSVSPENTYRTASGTTGCLCIGPSMDSQIITVLFHNILESAELLSKAALLTISTEEASFLQRLRDILERLPQPEIGKYGQIKEWAEDYEEPEPGHRHVSHLFALYPADLISPSKTLELSRAARTTLERRLAHGGGHTGWSRAWMINFWARLCDPAQVEDNIRKLLTHSTNPNLLDSHPPFQIDGNFGGAAGIAEALIQSHSDELIFLPALPASWTEGEVCGMVARKAFEVSFAWKDGRLTCAKIISKAGAECRVVLPDAFHVIDAEGCAVAGTMQEGHVFSFATQKNETYRLVFAS